MVSLIDLKPTTIQILGEMHIYWLDSQPLSIVSLRCSGQWQANLLDGYRAYIDYMDVRQKDVENAIMSKFPPNPIPKEA